MLIINFLIQIDGFLIVSSKLKIRRAKHSLSEDYLKRWKISTKDDGIQIKKKRKTRESLFYYRKTIY